MTDADRFLARFRRFGAEPSVATYLACFHPDATLFDSGMERPITVAQIPEHIEGILKLAQGFRMTAERWRFREPTIFVEARNRATIAGKQAQWQSVYCIDIAGDQVLRGRRYYDRRPLFALLAPNPPAAARCESAPLSFAEPIASAQALADACATRAAERASSFAVPDLRMEIETWAGDGELAFLEWSASGTLAGKPLRFGVADRFDLAAGRVVAARAYWDTLALAHPA